MEIIKPRTLSGFMELLPGKQIQFERMVSILRDTYASYGFAPLDTPAIEDAQILRQSQRINLPVIARRPKGRRGNFLRWNADCHASLRTGSQ